MDRTKTKTGKHVNICMDAAIAEQLDKFLEETGLSRTVAIEKAVVYYLISYAQTGKINP